MNAEQFLAYAETLRSYAQHSQRDLNAANFFVHTMLMQSLRAQAPPEVPEDQAEAA